MNHESSIKLADFDSSDQALLWSALGAGCLFAKVIKGPKGQYVAAVSQGNPLEDVKGKESGSTIVVRVDELSGLADLVARYKLAAPATLPSAPLIAESSPPESFIERHPRELAQYDLLTGLPDRNQFRDRWAEAMTRAEVSKHLVAVMFVNLDAFQRVNTELGHAAGDLVLQHLARRLKQCTRESDMVARLASDEFSLTLEGLDLKDQVIVVAQRVLAAMARPVVLGGGTAHVTASIGIALYPLDADDLGRLWKNADMAMNHAKQCGGNNYKFYSPETDVRSRRGEVRRSEVELNLRSLTGREQEVLDLLVAGNSNKLIASLLSISPRTVENHRARIMDKMQAASLPQLMRMVLDLRH